jgi:hypothetical protein
MLLLSGPDWLANLYLGCFVFGLIFTAISAFFSFGHMTGSVDLPHVDAGHDPGVHLPHVDLHPHMDAGHDAGVHVPHVDLHPHVDAGHAGVADAHGHVAPVHAGETVGVPVPTQSVDRGTTEERISPLNMPTILAAITWFGGVGYVLTRMAFLGWIMIAGIALVGGFLGGYIVYYFFAKVLWPAQTRPMDPMEYDLRGTYARVVSGIARDGTGEIMYTKGGTRSVAGARSADGSPLPKGSDVMVVRYERGLAYVVLRDAPQEVSVPTEARITTELSPDPAHPLPNREQSL